MQDIANFSHGKDKRNQMAKSFGQDIEKSVNGGKLDTSHLVLQDVHMADGKTEKRWVNPNKKNAEHAERGSAVQFSHKGEIKNGIAGRVAKNGQYEVHTDEGSIYKHPHQISPGDSAKVSNHAKSASDNALQAAMTDKKADPKLKEAAQKELERRGGQDNESKEQPKVEKKSVFHKFKEKKEIEKNGIDINDPETKEMYDAAKDLSSKDLEEIQENEKLTDKESMVIEHLLREKNYTEPVERMENYDHAIKQLISTPRANLFVYGKGGAGKSYSIKKELEAKYGQDAEYDPERDTYGSDYKFVFPDRVTPSALYELLYAHNGKILVFDDADEILKNPEVVNMLKKAMDTSDSRLGKDTKGGKPIELRDKATGETIEVPSSYKFTGKIVFISNKPKTFFTQDEDRRALLSRGKSIEMQFTNIETKDLIKDRILDGIKKNADWKTLGDSIPKDENGKPKKDTPQYKEFVKDVDHVFGFIEDHVDEIPEGKLNGRMIENLYQSYKYAQNHNSSPGRKKELNVDKYLSDQLLKGEEDELNDDLIKAEGSRGGKIIGHTKSGKAVYERHNANHEDYKDFDVEDHYDASELHDNKHDKMSEKYDDADDARDDEKQTMKHHIKHGLEHWNKYKELEKKGNKVEKSIEDDVIEELTDDIEKAFENIGIYDAIEKTIEAIKKVEEVDELQKAFSDILEKGGEGSRGGKIIGHTKSGKPIYDKFNHKDHEDFTKEDRQDLIKHFGKKEHEKELDEKIEKKNRT